MTTTALLLIARSIASSAFRPKGGLTVRPEAFRGDGRKGVSRPHRLNVCDFTVGRKLAPLARWLAGFILISLIAITLVATALESVPRSATLTARCSKPSN